jgi:hypothetical protein
MKIQVSQSVLYLDSSESVKGLKIDIYKSECMFVALLSGMFLGMYTINSLTP